MFLEYQALRRLVCCRKEVVHRATWSAPAAAMSLASAKPLLLWCRRAGYAAEQYKTVSHTLHTFFKAIFLVDRCPASFQFQRSLTPTQAGRMVQLRTTVQAKYTNSRFGLPPPAAISPYEKRDLALAHRHYAPKIRLTRQSSASTDHLRTSLND